MDDFESIIRRLSSLQTSIDYRNDLYSAAPREAVQLIRQLAQANAELEDKQKHDAWAQNAFLQLLHEHGIKPGSRDLIAAAERWEKDAQDERLQNDREWKAKVDYQKGRVDAAERERDEARAENERLKNVLEEVAIGEADAADAMSALNHHQPAEHRHTTTEDENWGGDPENRNIPGDWRPGNTAPKIQGVWIEAHWKNARGEDVYQRVRWSWIHDRFIHHGNSAAVPEWWRPLQLDSGGRDPVTRREAFEEAARIANRQTMDIAKLGEIAAKVAGMMEHHQNCPLSGESGSFCDCGYEIAVSIAEEGYATAGETPAALRAKAQEESDG